MFSDNTFGDNKSIRKGSLVPHSRSHEQHTTLAFNCMCKAVLLAHVSLWACPGSQILRTHSVRLGLIFLCGQHHSCCCFNDMAWLTSSWHSHRIHRTTNLPWITLFCWGEFGRITHGGRLFKSSGKQGSVIGRSSWWSLCGLQWGARWQEDMCCLERTFQDWWLHHKCIPRDRGMQWSCQLGYKKQRGITCMKKHANGMKTCCWDWKHCILQWGWCAQPTVVCNLVHWVGRLACGSHLWGCKLLCNQSSCIQEEVTANFQSHRMEGWWGIKKCHSSAPHVKHTHEGALFCLARSTLISWMMVKHNPSWKIWQWTCWTDPNLTGGRFAHCFRFPHTAFELANVCDATLLIVSTVSLVAAHCIFTIENWVILLHFCRGLKSISVSTKELTICW